MDLLREVNWACLEVSNKAASKRVLVAGKCNPCNNVGEVVSLQGVTGTMIATSEMGVTIFDLFNEILNENDLLHFLTINNIDSTQFKGAALILRCFLLLYDLNKDSLSDKEVPIEDCVKIEIVDSKPNIIGDISMFEDIEMNQLATVEDELDLDFHVSNAPKPKSRKRKLKNNKECVDQRCGCKKTFETEDMKRKHILEQKIYACGGCTDIFDTEYKLKVHCESQPVTHPELTCYHQDLPNMRIECNMGPTSSRCTETFASFAALARHLIVTEHWRCDPCNMTFPTKQDFNDHQNGYCKGLICPNCNKDFNQCPIGVRKTRFKGHVDACKNERSFVCDECGEKFNTKRGIVNHKKRLHTAEGKERAKAGRAAALAHAEARRVNPRNYACDQCDKRYTTNQRLKFHKQSVHEKQNEASCTCHICGKVLAAPHYLAKHIRKHHVTISDVTGERVQVAPQLSEEQKLRNRNAPRNANIFCKPNEGLSMIDDTPLQIAEVGEDMKSLENISNMYAQIEYNVSQ